MKRIAAACTVFIILLSLMFLSCAQNNNVNDDWHDDGMSLYVCPQCYGAVLLPAEGECERCGATTRTIYYKYCYDCAKELNCCQRCGKKR